MKSDQHMKSAVTYGTVMFLDDVKFISILTGVH